MEIDRVDNTVDDVMKALESLLHEGTIKEHKSRRGLPLIRLIKKACNFCLTKIESIAEKYMK